MRFLVALLAFAAAALPAAPPEVGVHVPRRTATIGDHVTVSVIITAEAEHSIGSLHLSDLGDTFEQIGIAEYPPPETTADGRVRETWRAVLAPFATGVLDLPTVSARWNGADGVSGEITADLGRLTVQSVLPAGETPAEPMAVRGPFAIPLQRAMWPWFVALGIVTAALLAWWLLRRRKRGAVETRGVVRARPPHELALEALDALERSLPSTHDERRLFFYAVTDAVRIYFEREFDLGAPEMTTAELLDALRESDFPAVVTDQVREWITTCDLVKYANQEAPEALCQRAVALARVIVVEAHQHHLARLVMRRAPEEVAA